MKECDKCQRSNVLFEPCRATCRECRNAYKIAHFRTKYGHAVKMHANQRKASTKRGHPQPAYSKEQLYDWLISQDVFHKLYDEWIASNYNKWQAPSVDRIDNRMGYSLENIRLMKWKENSDQAHEDCKLGKLSTGIKNIPIAQYSKDNVLLKIFPTMREAEREMRNKCRKEIKACCEGRRNQVKGYIWKYAEPMELAA